jgi:hypothetical protein
MSPLSAVSLLVSPVTWIIAPPTPPQFLHSTACRWMSPACRLAEPCAICWHPCCARLAQQRQHGGLTPAHPAHVPSTLNACTRQFAMACRPECGVFAWCGCHTTSCGVLAPRQHPHPCGSTMWCPVGPHQQHSAAAPSMASRGAAQPARMPSRRPHAKAAQQRHPACVSRAPYTPWFRVHFDVDGGPSPDLTWGACDSAGGSGWEHTSQSMP